MEIKTSRRPERLTKLQVDEMKARGLDDSQIRNIAKERGIKVPSANVEGNRTDWFSRAVGGAARFTGVEKLGQGLAYTLFRLTPEYKNLVSDLKKGLISPDQFETLTTGDITSGEVLGSAARTAGTILSAGQIGKVLNPKIIKGMSAVGNVKRGLKIGAGVGAGIGGIKGTVQGISRGEDIMGVSGSALRGAAGGAVIGAGVGALGGAVSGGAFLEGAKVGAIEGLKGGAIGGAGVGLGTALEEEQDISGLTSEVAGGAIRGGAKGAIFGGLIGGVTSSIGQGITNKITRKAELTNAIRKEASELSEMTGISPKTAPYTVKQGKIVKDKIFNQTVRDTSIPPRELSIVKGSQADDLVAYKKMINLAKTDDPLDVQRPVQVAGEAFNKRIKDIMKVKNQSGKEIGRIAQQNMNKPIDGLTEVVDEFADNLSSKGVKVGTGGRLDFKGSVFDDMPEVQRSLKTIFQRAQEMGNNGKSAHDLKRYIYERVNYDMTKGGITGTAQNVMKSFARDIDTILDSSDDAYRIANERFSTAISAQLDAQKIIGKGINLADDYANLRAGEVMNRVLGNAAAKPLQTLSDIESASRKLGFKYKDNVIAQIKFADILDDIVGPPTRSLAGQMERATNRVLNVRDLSSEVIEKGGDFLKKAMQRTPTERLDSLTRYINILSK